MIVFLKIEFLLLFLIFPIFFLLKHFRIISHFKIHLNLINWNEITLPNINHSFNFLSFLYKLFLGLAIMSLIIVTAEPVIYKTKK